MGIFSVAAAVQLGDMASGVVPSTPYSPANPMEGRRCFQAASRLNCAARNAAMPPDNRDAFAGLAHRCFATPSREEDDRERDSPGGTAALSVNQSRAPERCAAFPDRSVPRLAPPSEPVTVPARAGYRCWAQALPSPGPPPVGRAP